ncbi:MAG: hypothetical protein KIT22_04305 [Verrucomicrobiae bacterium]|nr:hypothetical protein [Verrucomicrobiae bacterium]
MNFTRGRHLMASLLLAVAAPGIPVRAADPSPPPVAPLSTNTAVTLSLTPPAAPATVPSITEGQSPVSQATPTVAQTAREGSPAEAQVHPAQATPLSVEEMETSSYAADFGLTTPGEKANEENAQAQRRLEMPSPEQIIEQHGAVGFLIRQPEPRNFLDIINPFAPAEFGPGERETYNRDPNLGPGAHLPRTFVNDITHEPVLGFWNWVW